MDVFAQADRHEPGTAAYFIGRDPDEPTVFTTYERCVDRAAIDAHNASPAVTAFFDVATDVLDGAAPPAGNRATVSLMKADAATAEKKLQDRPRPGGNRVLVRPRLG